MSTKTPEEILIPEVSETSALDLYNGSKIKLMCDAVEAEIKSIHLDPSNPKEYKHFGSIARRISSFKVTVDTKGKELVEPLKKQCKEIDASRKLVKDRMDALRDLFLSPRTEFDDKEKARAKLVADNIELFQTGHRKVGEFGRPTLAAWDNHIDFLKNVEITEEVYLDRYDEARNAKAVAIENSEMARSKWIEEEAALEAGRKALQEKADAEAAERHKQREAARQASAPEKNPAPAPLTQNELSDIEKKGAVHREIVAALESEGFTSEQAKRFVSSVFKGSVPHMFIEYPA